MTELESKLYRIIYDITARHDQDVADFISGKAAIECARVASTHFSMMADHLPKIPTDRTRICDYCGKQTRVTTAGCDHCDVEDK